jgi:PAP2 superfamily
LRLKSIISIFVGIWVSISSCKAQDAISKADVLESWYKLSLSLVRHTPTYSPPVASRAFAYLGVTAFEAVASGDPKMQSLAGQLNDLSKLPQRLEFENYDDAVVLNSALRGVAEKLFSNTGPSGQQAMALRAERLTQDVEAGVLADTLKRSTLYGQALAQAILQWSDSDGGANVENLGFPDHYNLTAGPGHWVPTSTIGLQQTPLLPLWGKNRTFALPHGATCNLPPPPEFSEETDSTFYNEARDVYVTTKSMTPEQKQIARFWSDDPMLSPTPPGHWISIAMQIFDRDGTVLSDRVDVLARLGIAEADAFIGCWHTKFQYNLLRPVTYIKKNIDPKWEPLLITPPFPEYPSGHSTQSGAAAIVLTKFFGKNFAFEDATHVKDGIKARKFTSFDAAADEAALSRLYGGIHFRAAIERGLDQGHCIGAYAAALRTRK